MENSARKKLESQKSKNTEGKASIRRDMQASHGDSRGASRSERKTPLSFSLFLLLLSKKPPLLSLSFFLLEQSIPLLFLERGRERERSRERAKR